MSGAGDGGRDDGTGGDGRLIVGEWFEGCTGSTSVGGGFFRLFCTGHTPQKWHAHRSLVG